MKAFFTDDAYAILDPMKGGLKAGGFTIVETLIVIAVSAGLFVSAAFLISGQQAKTEFQQSINQVTQQLQQIIGDVSNGYYPTNNVKCTTGGPSGKPLLIAGSSTLGTNSACVLLGKVVQFMMTPSSGGQQQLIVYNMAGLRQDSSGQNISNLTDANPIAVAPGNAAAYSTIPDNSVTTGLLGGLSVHAMTYTPALGGGPVNDNVAFAVLANPASSGGVSGGASGSQQLSLYAVNNTDATETSKWNVDKIDVFTNFVPVSAFAVCLTSGTTNQSGLITIGGNGRQLSVVLAIKGNQTCS